MSSGWSMICFNRTHEEVEANSDVGGLGVLIGFVGTAWIVVLFLIVHYVVAFEPEDNPFRDPPNIAPNDRYAWEVNPIDKLATEALLRIPRYRHPGNRRKLASQLKQATLNLADIQVLTGIGILLSGYISIINDSISAYHSQLLTYLAWFSNLTHFSCLVLLRGYLHQNQNERRWRLGLMAILWIGLVVAIGPTIWFNWASDRGPNWVAAMRTRCFYDVRIITSVFSTSDCYDKQYQSENELDACIKSSGTYPILEKGGRALEHAVVSLTLTIFIFFTRAVKVHQTWFTWTRETMKTRAVNWAWTKPNVEDITEQRIRISGKRGWRRPLRHLILFGYSLRLACYLTMKIIIDLFSSELSDVWWLFTAAVWGAIRFIIARGSISLNENNWAFGQILPVFLLLGPVMAIITPMRSRSMGDTDLSGPIPSRLEVFTQSENDPTELPRFQPDVDSDIAVNRNTTAHTVEHSMCDQSSFPLSRTNEFTTNLSTSNVQTPPMHDSQGVDRYSQRPQTINLGDRQNSYSMGTKWTKMTIMLVCAQIMSATAACINVFGLASTELYTFLVSYAINIFFVQPTNCLFAVTLDIFMVKRHPLRIEVFGFPLVFLILVFGHFMSVSINDYVTTSYVQVSLLGGLSVVAFVFNEWDWKRET